VSDAPNAELPAEAQDDDADVASPEPPPGSDTDELAADSTPTPGEGGAP
jgi:hypothetical protein